MVFADEKLLRRIAKVEKIDYKFRSPIFIEQSQSFLVKRGFEMISESAPLNSRELIVECNGVKGIAYVLDKPSLITAQNLQEASHHFSEKDFPLRCVIVKAGKFVRRKTVLEMSTNSVKLLELEGAPEY